MLKSPRLQMRLKSELQLRPALAIAVSTKRLEIGILLLVLGGIAFVRYELIAAAPDFGWDTANYLVTMHKVFGDDPTGHGLVRPPLIAFPLKLVTSLFEPIQGAKLLAVLSSTAIGVPMFFLTRRISSAPIALLVAFGFVYSMQFQIMMVWGFITFLGILFAMVTMVYVLNALQGDRHAAIAAGISGSLVIGMHQVSATILVVVFAIWGAYTLAIGQGSRRANFRTLRLIAIVLLISSLPYIPAYLSQITNTAAVATTDVSLTQNGGLWASLKIYGASFFPNNVVALAMAVAAFAIFPYLLRRDRYLGGLVLALMATWVAAKFLLAGNSLASIMAARLDFFNYIPLWITIAAVAVAIQNSGSRIGFISRSDILSAVNRLVVIGGLLVLILASTIGSRDRVASALQFFHYLGLDQSNAVAWISDNTMDDATIGVHPTPLGWWVEGMARRRAFETIDRTTHIYQLQLDESVTTELILSRAEGIHNGKWLAATMYPYESSASGTPLLQSYVGGGYYDAVAVDDFGTGFQLGGLPSETRFLIDAEKSPPVVVVEDGSDFILSTTYAVPDMKVSQEVALAYDSDTLTIRYLIDAVPTGARTFSVKLVGLQPTNSFVDAGNGVVHARFPIRTSDRGVLWPMIEIGHVTEGSRFIGLRGDFEQDLWLDFQLEDEPASVALNFRLLYSEGVLHEPRSFNIAHLLRQSCLDYLVLDEEYGSALTNGIPWRTLDWLDSLPLVRERISFGTVHIYEVVPDQVPGYHAACDAASPVEQAGG